MENSLTNSLAPNSRANEPLPDSFYLRPCLVVARDLLGKVLVCRQNGTTLKVQLTEVEAYLGDDDPASHAYRKVTPRNAAMYERGGTCYVYLSYGMNFCMNVVSGPEGVGHAILLRAAEPLVGVQAMRVNRGLPEDFDPRQLCSGPGKLAKALGVDLSYYGRRYDTPDFKIVDTGVRYTRSQIVAGPRIGISKAKDFPFRLSVKGSRWLSRKA
jgi:DNA-3-methyladenine glycosylase